MMSEPPQKRRRWIILVSLTCAATAVACALTSLLLDGFLPDLLSNFRIVYLIVLLFACVVCACAGGFKTSFCLLAVLLLFSGNPLMMLRPVATVVDHGETISILNVNTQFKRNSEFEPLRQVIHRSHPQIIALVEVNQVWLDALASQLSRYKYKVVSMEGPGLALYSTIPIESHEIRYFGKSHHPRIIAKLRLHDTLVDLLIVHPTTPKTPEGFTERNQELAIVGEEAAMMCSNRIVLGDFNCGPWSKRFEHLLTQANLTDSEQGFGPQPSWPVNLKSAIPGLRWSVFPAVPIDHVLVGPSVVVRKRQTGAQFGSDHLPVLVTVEVTKG